MSDVARPILSRLAVGRSGSEPVRGRGENESVLLHRALITHREYGSY